MSTTILRAFSIVIGLYFCSSHSDGLSVQCDGCIVSGDCKPHGSRWYDSNLCIDFRCRRYRQRQGEKQHFVYELLPDSDGCPYNNTCLKFGTYSDNKEECTRYKCHKTYEHTPILQKFYHGYTLIPIPYGCPDGVRCRENEEEWSDSCIKKRCIVAGNKTELHSERKDIGCYDNGECRQESETWKEGCHTKICRDGRIEIKEFGCRDDVRGVCRKIYEKWSEKYQGKDCIIWTCLKSTDDRTNKFSPRIEVVTKGCINADGNCYPRPRSQICP